MTDSATPPSEPSTQDLKREIDDLRREVDSLKRRLDRIEDPGRTGKSIADHYR